MNPLTEYANEIIDLDAQKRSGVIDHRTWQHECKLALADYHNQMCQLRAEEAEL